jgi:hypothetical protein
MGCVGALAATLGQEAALAAEGEQGVEQQGLGFAGHEAGAELTQDRGVETGIGQVEAEQVLPVPDDKPCSGTARASADLRYFRSHAGPAEPGWGGDRRLA